MTEGHKTVHKLPEMLEQSHAFVEASQVAIEQQRDEFRAWAEQIGRGEASSGNDFDDAVIVRYGSDLVERPDVLEKCRTIADLVEQFRGQPALIVEEHRVERSPHGSSKLFNLRLIQISEDPEKTIFASQGTSTGIVLPVDSRSQSAACMFETRGEQKDLDVRDYQVNILSSWPLRGVQYSSERLGKAGFENDLTYVAYFEPSAAGSIEKKVIQFTSPYGAERVAGMSLYLGENIIRAFVRNTLHPKMYVALRALYVATGQPPMELHENHFKQQLRSHLHPAARELTHVKQQIQAAETHLGQLATQAEELRAHGKKFGIDDLEKFAW